MSQDIYASFGVSGGVTSSSPEQLAHDQSMLELDVSARDGDDAIILQGGEDVSLPNTLDMGEEEESTIVEFNTEGGEGDSNTTLELDESTDAADPDADLGDDVPLDAAPDELVDLSKQCSEYAEGFDSMREQAISAGLPEATAARIQAEYDESNELSPESYEALAKAGFSAGFVRSFIAGQEAMADKYVGSIVAYAGGQDKFNRTIAHLQGNSPDSVQMLYDAIESHNLVAVKEIINLANASQTKKFGKAPARTVTNVAKPAARTAQTAVVGFESPAEMVTAMKDARYGRDKVYTSQVEQKVRFAKF